MILSMPLTMKEFEAIQDRGWISVIVSIDLRTMINLGTVDKLNDLADSLVLGELGCLSNTSYEVAGSVEGNILLKITGEAQFIGKEEHESSSNC